jgi:cytoskeletal protein CcmA (bactofilin family)
VFGRNSNPEPPKFPAAQPSAGQPPRPQAPSAFVPAPGSRPVSVIGSDLAIVGQKITLVCQSTLMVIGEVLGDINGDEVTIGDTGKVTGTITARSISVHGKVKGALRGETVALHPTAHIEGDVLQKNLIIAEGAKFDGRVRVATDPSEIKPMLDAAAVAAATAAP